MKRLSVLLLLCVGWSNFCLGQEDTVQTIFEVAEKSYVRGEFRQERHIALLSLPLISSGVFSFSREEGVVWQTRTPVQSRVEIRPSEGVLAGRDENTLQMVAASDVLAEIFLGIFSGNLDRLSRLFDIAESAGAALPADSNRWRLTLTPVSPALADHIERISLEGAEYVDSIALSETNGDSTRIRLNVLEAE